MGPDHAAQPTTGEFSDKIPPRFDGHADYAVYREDISLWTNLTSLPRSKHGPAMIGRLTGEAKTAAKTVPSSEICSDDGVAKILARLDKAYAIDQTNRLDIDLAEFLDYSWNKNLSVEHFISGFHTRVDKISELNLNDKLKGHLLLRQADLAANERHVVIGASSGSYNVGDVSAALRNIYRNSGSSTPATHRTSSQNNNPINDNDFVSDREGGGSVRNTSVKIFLKSGFQGWKKGGINIHVSVPLCEIWISIFLKSRFQEVESRVRKNLSGKNFNET